MVRLPCGSPRRLVTTRIRNGLEALKAHVWPCDRVVPDAPLLLEPPSLRPQLRRESLGGRREPPHTPYADPVLSQHRSRADRAARPQSPLLITVGGTRSGVSNRRGKPADSRGRSSRTTRGGPKADP